MVSPKVFRQLEFTVEGFNHVVTITNGSKVDVLEKRNYFPVNLGGAIFKMDFFVFDNLSLDFVIGYSTTGRLVGILDFHKSEFRFAVGGK